MLLWKRLAVHQNLVLSFLWYRVSLGGGYIAHLGGLVTILIKEQKYYFLGQSFKQLVSLLPSFPLSPGWMQEVQGAQELAKSQDGGILVL